MVKIKYLNRKGDEIRELHLAKAQEVLLEEADRGALIINESEKEKRMLDRAGITERLQESSEVTVYRPQAGG
jgi:hypothetical protein